MVKSPSGTPEPIEPRPPSGPPPDECPDIVLDVELTANAFSLGRSSSRSPCCLTEPTNTTSPGSGLRNARTRWRQT